jgi:uncharacterized protein
MAKNVSVILKPTTSADRIEMIDSLRGFALSGVCLANISLFSCFTYLSNEQKAELPFPTINLIISTIIYFFVDWKFWTLFSIMFGFGFAIFISRARERNTRGNKLYARRLSILLAIGLIHRLFFWDGDILSDYALVGFALLLLRNKTSTSVAVWGIIIATALPLIIKFILIKLLPGTTENLDEQSLLAYTSGSYMQIFKVNLEELKNCFRYELYPLTASFGRFMIGYWIGMNGKIRDIIDNIRFFKKVMRLCAWIGFPMMIALTAIFVLSETEMLPSNTLMKLLPHLMVIGSLAVGIYYAVRFALLYQDDKWKNRLSVFRELGRMALTNYLMQSVVNLILFSGFHLAGKIGPSIYILWFLVLIGLQILFSKLWLKRYQFGPVEWIWRSLTYGRLQNLKLELKPVKTISSSE